MGATLNLSVSKVSGSANVAENNSKIRIVLKITTNLGTYSQDGTTLGNIRIDGKQVASLNGKSVYINTTTTLYDAVHTIAHNDDGSKTVKVTAYFSPETPGTVNMTKTLEKTLELDRIQRGATLTFPAFTLGQAGNIAVSNSSRFPYDLTYSVGSQSGTLRERSLDDSIAWAPSLELAKEFPNSAAGKGTFTVVSYNGEDVLGTNTYEFTLIPPDSMAPEITGFTSSFKGNNAAVSQWGVGVKGKTKLAYTVTVECKQGASVESCVVEFAGASGTGLVGETGLLAQTGNLEPKVTVTDTRGKKTSFTGTVMTVYDYTQPAFISSDAYRADEDGSKNANGTHVAVVAAASYAPIGGNNSATLRARSRVTGGAWSGYSTLSAQQVNVLPGFSAIMSYEVEVSAVDSLGESRSVVYTIPTGEVSFHLRSGGKGAAFGMYSSKEGYVETDWPLDMREHKVENVAEPEKETDAATKGYVDNATYVPEMLYDTEYLTGEKFAGADVYAMVVDYGALPNNTEASNYKLAENLNVIDIRGFAVGSSYIIPIPGYYAVQNLGYTKSSGNLWISTTIDMSEYHGYITVKYTK